MSNNLKKALEDLIELGFVRVLTSGGDSSAYNGIATITELVKQANNRIEIMPGAGINSQNILEIATKTGASVFHSSAKIKVASKMEFRNQTTKMSTFSAGIGSINDEYQYELTSVELVEKMVEKIS